MRSAKLKLLTLGVISASLLSGSILAQEESNSPLDEIIVTSSLIPIPMRQIGTSVSVITEADIEAHGNFSLVDILRQMPAIATSNNGGSGKATSLRIRGEEGFRTLTIFDGMRLSDPSGPQIGSQLEHLLSDGIGRVEVLRGPQGLAYGADAGGVVNISSRSVEQGFFANFDAQAGEFGTNQLSANLGGGNETVDYFLSASDFETDGYNTRQSDSVLGDDDGYRNTTLHGRVGIALTEKLRLDLVHRTVDGVSEYDGCFSGATVHDCSADYELTASRAALSYSTDNFNHSLSFADTETDRQNYSLGVPSFGANGELSRLEYLGSATNLPGFNLVFGMDREEARNGDVSRDNDGYFLEYLSDFSESFFITAGIRRDDNDDFGSNTSHRVSATYLVDLNNSGVVKFKAALGTGFRAPSPYEIAYNTGPWSYPPASNTILSQEESEGYEFGVEYVLGNSIHLEAVYFDQKVVDAIYYDLATYSGYLQDIGTSTSQGIELTADLQLTDSLRLRSNYTYNDTERPNGLQRRRRPETLINLGLSYTGMNDRLNINGYYRVSRDAIDEVGATLIDLDNFEVLDISASYRVNDSISVYARLENAFDEDYEEITDYFSPDRAAYIGIKFNFTGG